MSNSRSMWAALVVLGLLLLAAWFGLHQSLMEINENWSTWYGHFAHGYLVLAVSIWLGIRAWRNRPSLRLSPYWPAIPALMLQVGVLLLSMKMQITTVNQSIVPPILLTALVASFGMQVGRLFFWPFAYLFFALPAWWVINSPLQELTIKVSMLAVSIAGIPVHVEGSMFELPAGALMIASGCSGLNYLITGLAIAFLQGFLYLQVWSSRLKLLAFTTVLMLFMNWVRVITVIAVGYVTDMQHYFIRVDHLTFGWILFLVALIPVYWFGFRLAGAEQQVPAQAAVPGAQASVADTSQVIAGGAIATLVLLAPACVLRYM